MLLLEQKEDEKVGMTSFVDAFVELVDRARQV